MGSGKGNPEGWVAVVKPGRVMFELSGRPETLAREAMSRAAHKLPIKTQVHHPRGTGGWSDGGHAELRELRDEELLERLEATKEELFNLRFQLATGQLDNPMRIKDVRHDVARILTVLRPQTRGRSSSEDGGGRGPSRSSERARPAPAAS